MGRLMPSLSLQQTRTYIDRLGDLENELTRSCRVAEVMSKGADKDQAAAGGRLKDACDSAREHLKYVAEAKTRLLEFDGFLHAQSQTIRESLDRPHMVSFMNEVGSKLGRSMESHVEAIVSGAIDALRRVAGSIKDMRDAKAGTEGDASAKGSAKALDKICDAAEKAIREGVKERKAAPAPAPEVEVEVEVELDEETEKMAAHGYNLTAGLPPEFLENIQKKKDEAKGKKDDDKEDEKDAGKKAYVQVQYLTAGLPPEFLENIQKKKDEAKGKKDDDKEDEKDAGKKAHGYTLTADSLTPGNESKGPKDEGEEDEGWVPGHRTDGKDKKAHGYTLTA